MRIAIILCCYNRKDMTKRCLTQLYSQTALLPNDTFKIYICDDYSTDGTYKMLEKDFPAACLIKSSGNLYWCKCMHKAMREAVKEDYDLYLMINDDVDFENNALEIMLQAYETIGKPCGIVGATCKTASDDVSYGGRSQDGKLLVPNGKLQQCVWANWNCFLADKEVVSKVGIIDGKYQHSFGDFDYSFRMRKMGYPIYLTADYIGKCDTNSVDGTFRDTRLGKRKQLKKLFSPKGMPFYSYMRYHIKVQGQLGFFRYLYGYLSVMGYIILGKSFE